MKLFLDDIRKPPDSSWDVVRDYNSFVKYIESNGVPDVISFDHDLGLTTYSNEKTGLDCIKYLIEKNLEIKEYVLHSANPVGKANMDSLIQSWKRHCETYIVEEHYKGQGGYT